MVDTAHHTLYKTRLTEHVHTEQTKRYLNRKSQTQEKNRKRLYESLGPCIQINKYIYK